MENSIRFNEKGDEFQFIFVGGGESIAYTSKIEGLKAICDLHEKEKITDEDFKKFGIEITSAENLPDTDPDDNPFKSLGGVSSLLAGLIMMSMIDNLPDQPTDVAYFKMCNCGGDHGRIYVKKGLTSKLSSKKEARHCITFFKENNLISDEESSKLEKEIEESILP